MGAAATEHGDRDQELRRLASSFGALVHEEIEAARKLLQGDTPDLSSCEGALVDHAVRLVLGGAEWMGLAELAGTTRELHESLAGLAQLRASALEERVAHCRVQLDRQAKLAQRLHPEALASSLAPPPMEDSWDGPDESVSPSPRHGSAILEENVTDLGPRGTLLGLTVEIKSAIVSQNERLASMGELVDQALQSVQSASADAERVRKGLDPRRTGSGGRSSARPIEERAMVVHRTLHEATATLRSLSYELNRLQTSQYSLERRARDLDEHLLWDLLDPLERYIDDLVAAVSRRSGGRGPILTVETGGVGFEPEIGSILVPGVVRLLESAQWSDRVESATLRVTAAREGLEARLSLEGRFEPDPEAVARLEEALEGLAGFLRLDNRGGGAVVLTIQFPMARSLRSFLIVEAAGQRVALPWSAVDRIHATRDDEVRGGGREPAPGVFPLAALFTKERSEPAGGPLAVLRCGGRSAVVGFDRIVWRESARLTPLPSRLNPAADILGGIVSPDGSVTLVLDPCALIRRIGREVTAGSDGGGS